MKPDSGTKTYRAALAALDEEHQLRRMFLSLVNVESESAMAMAGAKAMTLVARYRRGLRKLDQSNPVVAFLTDQLDASLKELPAKLWPQNYAARKTRTLAKAKLVSIGDYR